MKSLKIWLLVYYYFVKAFITKTLAKKETTKFDWAAKNLFYSTFRIPESERRNKLLVLNKYIIFIKDILKVKSFNDEIINENQYSSTYIYDVFSEGIEERIEYCEYFSKEKIGGAIIKTKLNYSNSFILSIIIILSSIIFLPFVFIASLFEKDKAPYAMLWKEMIENYQLIKTVKERKITAVYFFCIFEKDANIATLLLNKIGIIVNKIPSEVPIAIWNKIIIADKLCVCNGYQFDELTTYKESIFINETEFWGPELILQNIDKYNKPTPLKKNTIGFYSTGSWVRKRENHIDQGIDMETNEELLKSAIKEFCIMNSDIELLIFLHPRERWGKYYDEALNKYNSLFSGINYTIIDKEIKSTSSFELVNLGVAFQSTLVYERLYYGFKTLLMPLSYTDFPVQNSSMHTICAFSKEELFRKIKNNFQLTNTEFFNSNGINHYAKFIYN